MECLISNGRTGATVTGAYLGDSISQLVEASAALLSGEGSAVCEFYEEPGLFAWALRAQTGILQIQIQWHEDDEQLEGQRGESMLDLSCELKEFAHLVLREMDRLLEDWGESGYAARWGFPYPQKQVALLRERLAAT